MPPLRRARLLSAMLLSSLGFAGAPLHGASPEPLPAKNASPAMTSVGVASSSTNRCTATAEDAKEWTTAERHETVVLHSGTTLILAPHTRVLRLPMITTALGGREFAKSAYNVELVKGRIDIEIDPKRRPIYGLIVRTGRKVGAVVKHGRATVSMNDGDVTVAARSGKDMMVAIGDRFRPLRVGRAFVVSDATPEGLSRALLAAPVGKVDRAVAVAIGANMTPQRLSWTEIPHNKGYLVQVFRKTDGNGTLVTETRVDATSLTIGKLDAGRYFATIASIDESNLESSPSVAVAFRVVEAVLPPGASVDGAVIQLPIAERLQLHEVENLELSYGTHGDDFVTAPPSVGLHDGGPVSIRLRERGSAHETHLALEPLDVIPTIELGPRRARWPGPPVTIDVLTKRRDGSPTDAEPFFRTTVTVNSEPVNVVWRKSPGRMSFGLDQPQHRGPWIVRVMVHDARGREVARDFLEIAETPTAPRRLAKDP